ncbi:MAG: polysaccharide biosynthesis protein [Defluviitaleaceae bacterium]|nr:polysaccharide biosynthesis protein [Defluviitaleaceae bacterium]MCL2238825.1 polysaccharide biosynthesis protein [Defluviitaleaceae bacterium]
MLPSGFFRRFRKPILVLVDFVLFSASYFSAWFMLMRRIPLPEHQTSMMLGYLFFAVIFFAAFWLFGMYESLWRYAEAYEFLKCMMAIAIATVVFMGVTWLVLQPPMVPARLPLTVYFVSAYLAGSSALFSRTAYRVYRTAQAGRRGSAKQKKVLVVGVGKTGVAVIQGLAYTPHRYDVMCAVDDDPGMHRRRIGKVRVDGTVKDIPRLVEKYGIQVILLALPNATAKERRRISSICATTPCELKKVPDLLDFEAEEARGADAISRIEDVSVEDLLGREVIDIRSFKAKRKSGQTVLVTGAGGTIGSELCRQAAAQGAAKLVMLDVVENGLYAVQQEILFKFGADFSLFAEVASVRDEDKLDMILARYKPDIIYHAAAHKHVPLMEAAPEEAVKNNIYGTLNMARAAQKHGVKRFVLISTDKAVNPTNVYGATKRVCEMVVQSMGQDSKTEFVSVRFGNVLGSNGSVIPLFKAQIAAGGPVRVTHKEIIRYYMTVSEAVSLVITAGDMAKGGEIFVLDMGDPVKTLDLAEMLIRLSGLQPYKDIDIVFSGLRPGEKLYEELLMDEEGLKTTANSKIFVGKPIDISPEYLFESLHTLKKTADKNDRAGLVDKLKELVPGYTQQ